MDRIAIVGGGGVGGYLAARLAQAGKHVALLARGAHLEAIRRNGLELRAADGTVRVPPDQMVAAGDARAVGQVDLLVVAVKAYDLEAAMETARPVIGQGTVVLPLQNGVDAADRIRARAPAAAVLGGVARIVASIAQPGVIQAGMPLHITIGALEPSHLDAAHAAIAALDVPGVKAVFAGDVQAALWTKYVFICALSGMTCLCRTPAGPLFAYPETAAMVEQVMREVEAIGRARGVQLPADVVAQQLAFARKLDPASPSSMLVDLLAGRRLELDALHGNAARMARAAGVATPAIDAIVAALRPSELGRSSPSTGR